MQKLLILGTGSGAILVADLALQISGFHVAGFVENREPERCRMELEGLAIIWVDDVGELAKDHLAVCGIDSTYRPCFAEQVAKHGMSFATLIHPSVIISSKSSVGEGTSLSPGVIIAAHSRLGRHVFVNRGALIGHHTEIGDYAAIMPGANIAGHCIIGESTQVGMGALVREHVAIGKQSIVAMGAVVTKDVPDNVQVAGAPARIVKTNVCRGLTRA